MYIKYYRQTSQRVPDPMRPGRTVATPRLVDPGQQPFSHDGQQYEPDAKGWFDVPQNVGEYLCKFRVEGGSGFYPHGAIAEAARLGSAEMDDPAPAEKPRRRAVADA